MTPDLLRRLMAAAGLTTQKDFADALGVEERTVRNWLAGKPMKASSQKLVRDYRPQRSPSAKARIEAFWDAENARQAAQLRREPAALAPAAPAELTPPPPAQEQRRSYGHLKALAAGVAALCTGLGWVGHRAVTGEACPEASPGPAAYAATSAPVEPPQMIAPGGLLEEGVQMPILTSAKVPTSSPVPAHPFKGQATAPCSVGVDINGSCWGAQPDPAHKGSFLRAPCPLGTYESDGFCYIPVGKTGKPLPASADDDGR